MPASAGKRCDIRKQPRVLVTGAHGFLGRHVAKAYSQAGCQVVGIGHGTWSRAESSAWGLAEWHAADVTCEALHACAGEPEVVVHCAGSGHVGFSLAHPLQDFERNVETTAAALEFLRLRARHATMVLVSTAAVYGEATAGAISEEAAASPLSPYGAHKYLAEQLCRSYARSFDLRVFAVRLFSVYGPGLRKQLLWDACRRLSAGESEFGGTGRELRDWLHISDAVELIQKLARMPQDARHTVFNGGTGVGVAVLDVIAQLSSALGAGNATFNGQRRAGDPSSLVADASRARALGWQPKREWRAGVREYAEWFRKAAG